MDNNLNSESNNNKTSQDIQQSQVQPIPVQPANGVITPTMQQTSVTPIPQGTVQQSNQNDNSFVQNNQSQNQNNKKNDIISKIVSVILFIIVIIVVISFIKNKNNSNNNNENSENKKNNVSEEVQKNILGTDISIAYDAAKTQEILGSFGTRTKNYYCYYFSKENSSTLVEESNECVKLNCNIKNDVSVVIIFNQKSYVTQIAAISGKYILDLKKDGETAVSSSEFSNYLETSNKGNKRIYISGNNSEYNVSIK